MGFRPLHAPDDSPRHQYGHEHHRPLEQEKISTKSILSRSG